MSTTEPEDPKGFLFSLLGSVRTHIEDRLQSPFAGAFAIAWLVVNWKAVLILAFSASPIENRIDVLSKQYLSLDAGLWLPLWYAVIGVIGYYLVATAFLALYELYGMARRWVEIKFDKHRWVNPESYIRFKREMRRQIDDLSSLASDHTDRIEQLSLDLANSEATISLREADIQQLQISLSRESDERAQLKQVLFVSQNTVQEAQKVIDRLEKEQIRSRVILGDTANTIEAVKKFINQSKQSAPQSSTSALASLMRPNMPSVADRLMADVSELGRQIGDVIK